MEPMYLLNDLYIHPDYRNLRIGLTLIKEFLYKQKLQT